MDILILECLKPFVYLKIKLLIFSIFPHLSPYTYIYINRFKSIINFLSNKYSFFFSLPAHNTFHEWKIQIEPFSTSAGEGKQTGQTGYNGPATREAKLARRWGIYIGFSRPDSDLLGIRPSVLPSLLFPPSIDASSPLDDRCTTPASN